jgi:hypothetical protein
LFAGGRAQHPRRMSTSTHPDGQPNLSGYLRHGCDGSPTGPPAAA